MPRIVALLYPGWEEAESTERFQVIAVLAGAVFLWFVVSAAAFAVGVGLGGAEPGAPPNDVELVAEREIERDLMTFTGVDLAGLTARQRERLRGAGPVRGILPQSMEMIDKTPALSAERWEAGHAVGFTDLQGHQGTVVVELPLRYAQELAHPSPEPPATGAVESVRPAVEQPHGVMAEGQGVIQPFRPVVEQTDPLSGGALMPRAE